MTVKGCSLIPCVNLMFCWWILSHMCVPLCFLNFPVHGTICLHLEHIMLPFVYSRVNIWITKLRISGIDFQEVCLFITCFLVFLFLWKGSQYLSQCHLKHNYFFISAMKSYWSILSCLMLLIRLKSGKFYKKDKNAKVCYGEYQYVSTQTLTMSEFDPAFLAFIRCRILSLIKIAILIQELRRFCWRDEFCLLVELQQWRVCNQGDYSV